MTGCSTCAWRVTAEILVVDGARGFGNARVLPAGPLRESLAQLAGADLIIVNGAAEHPSLAGLPAERTLSMQLAMGDARRVDGHGVPRPLREFQGQRVHAVAGIGNPARFFRALRAQGMELDRASLSGPPPLQRAGADLRR